MKKIILAILGVLMLLTVAWFQIGLVSKTYSKEGSLVTGMATLADDAAEPAQELASQPKEKTKNMNPGGKCGNGICELNEFNYNCPEDC